MPMNIRRTTVLIGADERISTKILVGLLEGHDFNVLGATADGRELVDAARRMKPAVVIIDVSMSGWNAIDVLRAFAAEHLNTKVIVLALHNDSEAATEALRAGAAAFLLQESIGQELIHAVHLVAQGHVYIAAAVTDAVMERMGTIDDALDLTERQRDVLLLTVKGRSLHEIAVELNLSTRAVETHKHEIMQTLGVQSTADLIRFAIEHRPRLH
jgi:DNA-binding NarL/FixJ family response regulator